MKIRFLYLILSFFLFGSLYVDDSFESHLNQVDLSKSTQSISLDLVNNQLKLHIEEIEIDHSLFVNTHSFQLSFLALLQQEEFSQTFYVQKFIGGHSGLSPPKILS